MVDASEMEVEPSFDVEEHAPKLYSTQNKLKHDCFEMVSARKNIVIPIAIVLLVLVAMSFVFVILMPSFSDSNNSKDPKGRLETLIDNYWDARMQQNTLLATLSGEADRLFDKTIPPPKGSTVSLEQGFDPEVEVVTLSTILPNITIDSLTQYHDYFKLLYQELQTIPFDSLSAEEQANYAVLDIEMRNLVEQFQYNAYLMPVSSMYGPQVDLPQVFDSTVFREQKDYFNFILRLLGVPLYINQTIALMEIGIQEGYTVPCESITGVPDQIKGLIVKPAKDSPFYYPFLIAPAEKFDQSLKVRALAAVDQVTASFQQLYDYFTTKYQKNCRPTIAASDLPNGAAYYQFLVRLFTNNDTTTPQEVHDIGLSEMTRIRKAMDLSIQRSGFSGTFDQYTDFLRTSPQFYFNDSNSLMQYTKAFCKDVEGLLPTYFGKLPRCPFRVFEAPAAQAPSEPSGFYIQPDPSCSHPGTYYINTYDLPSRPIYGIPSLSLHESVPGHHLQIAIQAELEGFPAFRVNGDWTAFIEGWALYAESLGEDMGLYTNPHINFGRLDDEMLRAGRLVVDTGIHALNWTRQQAIDLLVDNSALSVLEVTSEVDRYISWPGQALAYKSGQMKILDLKRQAKSALGVSYDERAFHDVVLGEGSIPLQILDASVQKWIKSVKASTAA